jgi:hypothetical protein
MKFKAAQTQAAFLPLESSRFRQRSAVLEGGRLKFRRNPFDTAGSGAQNALK